jgi:hypothetical protein
VDSAALSIANTIISGVNLLTLIVIAFKGGHWMGRVEVRIETLEKPRAARRADEE